MKFICTILFFIPILCCAKPTSNIVNVIYSLPDDFFEQYGYPNLTFEDRITICQSSMGTVYKNDTVSLGGMYVIDKYSFEIYCEGTSGWYSDRLLFKLVKDKKKKRDLLLVFHRSAIEERIYRADVYQYDKKVKGRWKEFNASEIFPKLTWHDLYQGINEDAEKNIFTMRPALDVSFSDDGIISLNIAYDYIETKLPEVQEYLENNPVDANSITLHWDKKQSKYIAKII